VIRFGVIGYGYWGPNLVRNIAETKGAEIVSVSDLRSERLALVQRRYPGTTRYSFQQRHIDAVQNHRHPTGAQLHREQMASERVLPDDRLHPFGEVVEAAAHVGRFRPPARSAHLAPDPARVNAVGWSRWRLDSPPARRAGGPHRSRFHESAAAAEPNVNRPAVRCYRLSALLTRLHLHER
jgi:hypothetical protein